MKQLRISIGGVRGIVGEALTPDIAVGFAQAFGTYAGPGRVLVSRDTRRSGPMVLNCVQAGLLGTGCEVVDLGVCPTAALQLAVRRSDAVGGIAVTAGHNDLRWNALKFIRGDGIFLNPGEAEQLLDLYHQGEFTKATWSQLRPVASDSGPAEEHLAAILEQVDVELLRSRKLKVAVDCVNGACSEHSPRLLRELGCEPVAINTDLDMPPPRPPEPSPRYMSQLSTLVKASGADIGFAHDADGDRLGVVCEDGSVPSEETTLCLVEEFLLSRGDEGPVVTNLSTTMAVDEIARRHGGRKVIRTHVGQAYIAEAALNHGAAVAGEGSGGVVLPKINYAHDSLAAMAHILQLLAEADKPISRLLEELVPPYHMVKLVVPCRLDDTFRVLQRVREIPPPEWAISQNLDDGIKYLGHTHWVHIRASQTEPLIRVIAEAQGRETSEELAREWVAAVRRSM
ncbi:MAG: phosphoglucosamine mutase [Armatimonadetes bacterium]|nr:phosphoglucosamine mutase [Armatimonadota bacterium]